MHNLYIMWLYAFRFVQANLAPMPSVCCIPNYYLQNCVYLYLVPLLMHLNDNFLVYVCSCCYVMLVNCLGVVGADVSTGDSKSPCGKSLVFQSVF